MVDTYDELLNELRDLKAIVLNDGLSTINSGAIYLKVEKAAEFLSISAGALRVMVTRNQVPHIKKLGKLYFLKSDLINWLEGGRVEVSNTSPEDILIPKCKKPLQSR